MSDIKTPSPKKQRLFWPVWDTLVMLIILTVVALAIAVKIDPIPWPQEEAPQFMQSSAPTLVCIDSDNSNFDRNVQAPPDAFRTGYVTYGYEGHEEKIYDTCLAENMMREVWCPPNSKTPGFITYPCYQGCWDGRCLP